MNDFPLDACASCLLYKNSKTPFMKTSGSKNPDVLFVFDSPHYKDDEEGVYAASEGGFYLRKLVKNLELDVAYTSLLKCFPGSLKPTKTHVEYCKSLILDDIERLNPKIVVLIGNLTLLTFLGYGGISSINGSFVEKDGILYMPLYNPSFILRNMHVEEEFLTALLNLQDRLESENDESSSALDDYNQIIVESLADVEEMRINILAAEYFVCDLETNTLDFTAVDHKILTLNFLAGKNVYMLPYKHSESMWLKPELDAIKEVVIEILTKMDGKLVNHNVKFDQLHLYREFGVFCRAEADTMLISYMVNTRGLHGLKRLSTIHIGLGGYDDAVEDYKKKYPEANPNRGGSYANIPLHILLPYGGLDVIAVDMLYPILLELMSDQQVDFFYEVIMPASDTLALIEWNGIALDSHIVQRYHAIYSIFRNRLHEEILSGSEIEKATKLLQAEHDRKKLGELCDEQLLHEMKVRKIIPINKETVKLGDVTIGEVQHIVFLQKDAFHYHMIPTDGKPIKRRRKRTIITFNIGSVNHLRMLYFNVMKIKSEAVTKTGQLSTSSSVMNTFVAEYPIVSKIRLYALYNKMLSTYIGPAFDGTWKSYDSRVRSTYNLHITKTGRLSSTKPNLQNIPTPEKEPNTLLADLPVKNIFTHSYWDRTEFPPVSRGYLVAFDYSGMELRVIASIANCTGMIEAFANNFDIHCYVTRMIFSNIIPPDTDDRTIKKEYTPYRYRAKWVNWTLLYGGTKYTLMNLYGVSEEEATTLVDSYYEAFPEILDFREYTTDFTYDNGYIESVFGRRELLPEIKSTDRKLRNKAIRSAVNMPIQSTASDILLCALIVITDKLKSRGLKSRIVNTVHDSIVLDVPEEELDDVVILVKDCMENVVEHAKTYMPSIDFSWLRCPLKADAEIGTHYGHEKSYTPTMQ